MNAFLKNKNKIILFLVFVLFVFMVTTQPAHAFFGIGEFTANAAKTLVNGLLYLVYIFIGFLFILAGVLFSWIVQPDNVNAIVGNDVVHDIWVTVRDFTNMFFILMLLFSAFATIFQISKYHIKNTILNIVLMALFVNFSFPIARAIIDISNVVMYGIMNGIFVGDAPNFGASIGASFNLTSILMPTGNLSEKSITYMLVAIIFLFLLTITIIVLAILLIIRIIVLSLLVMFSPVGFVGFIFPGKVREYASGWWDALVKYSFNGPIMVFFLAVSIKLATAIGDSSTLTSAMEREAAQQNPDPGDANFIARAAFLSIPLIALWTGIGMAQKMGIGAKGVVERAQKFAKGTRDALWTGTNIPGTYKKAKDDFSKKGKLFGKKVPLMGSESREAREDRWSAFATGGNKARIDKINEQARKKNKDIIAKESEKLENESERELHVRLKNVTSMRGEEIANMGDKELQEYAGAIKQASSRGAKYEKEVEEDLKKRSDAPMVIKFEVVPGMTQEEITRGQALEKQQKDAQNKWVQQEKAKIIENARTVVKEAEKRGMYKNREERNFVGPAASIEGWHDTKEGPPAPPPPSSPRTTPAPSPTPAPTPAPTHSSVIVDQYGNPHPY